MRRNLAHDRLHPLHDLGKVDLGFDLGDAVALRIARIGQQPRRAQQRLGRHAAGVEAVAAHAVALDQRHLRARGRGDIGRHQPGRAGADHDQVEVVAARARMALVHAPRVQPAGEKSHDQRQQAEQHERPDQPGRQHVAGRLDPRELGARVHVGDRPRQHAGLADQVEPARLQRGQSGEQVDEEKRHHRHQPQREQVIGAIARDTVVERAQALAVLAPQAVAQHET